MRQARSIVLFALVLAGAHALPDEQRHVSLVPWKVLARGEAVDAPLVLFWIPDSASAMRRSPLLTSDDLTLYAARCVAMRVVRLDDEARLHSLGVEKLPVAVLADGSGRVIGSAPANNIVEVEELVREELNLRTYAAEELLDDARRHADEGDVAAALELYRKVWDARCLCPRQGKIAQKALRRLAKR